MAYTAPTNVQTKADAILALASTIAGEDKTALGNGSVNKALDVLADVLAQQDVDVPQTNAGAILALAQYAQGGGGASTQTLTVTKQNAGDTVVVWTISWADYIADSSDADAWVVVQPDSTDGLVSVYSIPIGTSFWVSINDSYENISLFIDALMNRAITTYVMPSTPLYASARPTL